MTTKTKTNIIRYSIPSRPRWRSPFRQSCSAGTPAKAQCTEVLSGLREPIGSLLTDQGNLLISESGDATPGSGRISIVDPSGNRRTLLDGLPSAPADVGDPSGPTGIIMRGRNLYVLMGTGDVGIMGPRPGTTLENPNGPSSPIFSSVLVMQFSAETENWTTGFTLTPDDEQALADGEVVTLSTAAATESESSCWLISRTSFPFLCPTSPTTFRSPIPLAWCRCGGCFT